MFGDHPDDWTEHHEIPAAMWAALQVFQAIGNQWRTDFSGVVALDYNVLPFILDTYGIPAADRLEIFHDVRTMERAALDTIKSLKPAA